MNKQKTWNDDINAESVDKASEILPKIELPQPGDTPIIVQVTEEPYPVLDKEGREMFVGTVKQQSPNQIIGSMVYPKSLRFNIAKALNRNEKNYKKTTLTGLSFKIWSVYDNNQKFYQADLWTPPDKE